MLFNSYEFLFIFLPISALLYWKLRKIKNAGHLSITLMTIFSIVFYCYWSIYSLPYFIASVITNFTLGRLMEKFPKNRYVILVFGISINIIYLSYFKYINFIFENLNLITEPYFSFSPVEIIFPIGISFFTFTQIAFLVDSYLGKTREPNFIKYLLFASYYPHLIVGPIVHHKDLVYQFECRKYKANDKFYIIGISLIVIGLSKKILLADQLGVFSDLLFNGVSVGETPKFMMALFGTLAYTFQIYFDFSGYSDMAVGISLIYGIIIPANFNSPLRACSIIDFWNSWHISLSRYIRDYLYTPIAFRLMRYSSDMQLLPQLTLVVIFPVIFSMVIVGLWHGAGWNFILFGFCHGIFLLINRLFRKFVPSPTNSGIIKWIYWVITFASVSLSLVIFRADSVSDAIVIFKSLAGYYGLNSEIFYSNSYFKSIISGVWQINGDVPLANLYAIKSIFLIFLSFIIVKLLPSTAMISLDPRGVDLHKTFLCNPMMPFLFAILLYLSIIFLSNTSQFLYFRF
jgi:alginate O-acetyltransferase complex protein AlgI